MPIVPLAHSWNYPPEIIDAVGFQDNGYDKGERAYKITPDKDDISFTLNANEDSPVVNPCFIISRWDNYADVTVEGTNIETRQGLVRDTSGNLQLVLWLMYEAQTDIEISINQK